MYCDNKKLFYTGVVVGALLLIIGGILIPVGDKIIQDTINKEAVIEEGTLAYENWIQTGSLVYRQFWLFNVKNPSEIMNLGAKPVLEQKGPYTYRVRQLPKDIITVSDNHTISYRQPYSAVFQPDMSAGSETDQITALNFAAAAAASVYPPITHGFVNLILNKANASLFQTRTVVELLWGYEDPILKQAQSKDPITGLFYPYNGSSDGIYEVYTGKDDINKVAIIDRWMNKTKLTFWDDPYCDMINGTDASSFPPFLHDREKLYFYSSDICRSIFAEYEQKKKLKGIPVHRFVVPPKALESFLKNPDNHCYCKDMSVSQNCTFGGILGISVCKEKKPIYISLPHFLYATDEIVNAVDGLSPNKEEHETFLDVEPVTGFTLRVAKRIQINLMFKPSKKIKILKNIKEPIFFPLVWLNETGTVDDDTAKVFRGSLTTPMTALGITQLTLICIGSLLFLSCVISVCRTSMKKETTKKNVGMEIF
ncbi:platelet glycoprotein 4 isoform X1 [Scyliorhinus canicula]|uniref:platelet glycoprotein 4 isoform X1 n=1 Tax=Scyliorhinus canicula TaxID=7830 RepID=UPI0018F592CF|nr:platelet glycoprotein 4 isoform X1 [Scyliorhinus canicula]